MLYLFGALLQGFGLVLVQPFVLKILNDKEWGQVAVSVSVVQVGVVIAAAGLPLAITRAYFMADRGPERAQSINGALSLFGLMLGSTAAIGYAVFQVLLHGNSNHWPMTIALITLGFQSVIIGGQAYLRAQLRPLSFIALSSGASVFANICGLLAVGLIVPSATAYLCGYSICVAATAALSLFLARVKSPFALPGVVRGAWKLALPVLPHTAALMLLSQGAVFLLSATAGAERAGDYAKVLVFATGTISLLGALNNAWVPSIMSASPIERPDRIRATLRSASIALIAIVIVASAGGNLGTYVLAEGQKDLIPIAQTLPLLAIGYVLYLVSTTLLFADGRTGVLAIVTPTVVLLASLVAYIPAQYGNLNLVAIVHTTGFALLGIVYLLIAKSGVRGTWGLSFYFWCSCISVVYVIGVRALPTDHLTGILTVAVTGGLGMLYALIWRILQARHSRRSSKAFIQDPENQDGLVPRVTSSD